MRFSIRLIISFVVALAAAELLVIRGFGDEYPILLLGLPVFVASLSWVVTGRIVQHEETSRLTMPEVSETDTPIDGTLPELEDREINTINKQTRQSEFEHDIIQKSTDEPEEFHDTSKYETIDYPGNTEEVQQTSRAFLTDISKVPMNEPFEEQTSVITFMPKELSELHLDIDNFSILNHGQGADFTGLKAITIHQSRIALYYDDAAMFKSKLTGYDKEIHGFLERYLAYLENCINQGTAFRELLIFFQRYIEPILSGYEHLWHHLENKQALNAFNPTIQIGYVIRKYIRQNTFDKSFAA